MVNLTQMEFVRFRKESSGEMVGVFKHDPNDGYMPDVYVYDKEAFTQKVKELEKQGLDTSILKGLMVTWPA